MHRLHFRYVTELYGIRIRRPASQQNVYRSRSYLTILYSAHTRHAHTSGRARRNLPKLIRRMRLLDPEHHPDPTRRLRRAQRLLRKSRQIPVIGTALRQMCVYRIIARGSSARASSRRMMGRTSVIAARTPDSPKMSATVPTRAVVASPQLI